MGTMRICKECGRSIYSVATVDFGNNHFCESCAEKIGLSKLIEFADENQIIDFCDPYENLELYTEQLRTQDLYHDELYHQLKINQLK